MVANLIRQKIYKIYGGNKEAMLGNPAKTLEISNSNLKTMKII